MEIAYLMGMDGRVLCPHIFNGQKVGSGACHHCEHNKHMDEEIVDCALELKDLKEPKEMPYEVKEDGYCPIICPYYGTDFEDRPHVAIGSQWCGTCLYNKGRDTETNIVLCSCRANIKEKDE
jgi:hypothetical protein